MPEIFSRRALGGTHPDPRGGSRRSTVLTGGTGLACLATVAVILVAAPGAAVAGTLLLVAAMTLLLPTLVGAAVAALGWLGQWVRSAVPAIALMELRARASRTRTLALAATAAVAVFGIVAVGGAHRDLERGLNSSADEIDANADLWVSFRSSQNAFATAPISLDGRDLDRVRALPGVATAERYRGAFLDIGDRRLWVLAPPRSADAPVPPRQILTAADDLTRRVRAAGWVTLSEALAQTLDAGVGDAVRIPAPEPITLRVAAITTNLGWPSGALILSADDFAKAWGSTAPTALHIELDGVRATPTVRAELAGALAPRDELQIETAIQRQRRHHAMSDDALSRLTQISMLVIGAAVLAMVTAMVGALWQRRSTFAGLKADGFTEWELWRAVLLDSAVLLSTACGIGAAFGLAGQALMSRALAEVTGFPVFYSPGIGLAFAVLGGVTLLTLACHAVPGYIAVRIRPAPGIGT
ncbi:MAG TPA: ABC transporter permease [Capillimicrobium sp.]|nr:ABC transporter permease [Capillimicrobium sp.]